MVDFVKIYTHSKEIRNVPFLEFEVRMSTDTGELKSYRVASWKNLKFKSYDNGRLEISGSLHKFRNEGVHNHNEFTPAALRKVINDLSARLPIQAPRCQIVNIEFGLNIPYRNPQKILRSTVGHRNQLFDIRHDGYYRQCRKREIIIKCYNKSEQYGLDEGVFRFELKYIRARGIQKFGISHLVDLLGSHWVAPVCQELLSVWNAITIIEFNKIPSKYQHWKDPYFWSRLTKESRYKQGRRYKQVVGRPLQEEISRLIEAKGHQFTLQV